MKLLKWLWLCFWSTVKQFFSCKWIWGGSVVSFFTLLLIPEKLLKCSTEESICYTVCLLVAVLIVWYIINLFDSAWEKLHYAYAETVYGTSLQTLSVIIGSTGKLIHQNDITEVQTKQVLTQLCDNLESLFSSMTKSKCAVSIKVFVNKDDDIAIESCSVINLVRDSKHFSRNTDKYKEINHTIIGNSSYSYVINNILKGNGEFLYVNNSINSSDNYLNTSKDVYSFGVLPYNSELVYPLLPAYCKKDRQENQKIVGFLCVDSEKTNCFPHTEYIQEIMRIASNQIYNVINSWRLCQPKQVQQ